MTAHAGPSPETPRDLTRPDLPLPEAPGTAPAPPPLPRPPEPPASGPAPAAPPASAGGGRNWHRFHYPIGIFLVAYGATGFATALIGWNDRREELAGYIGAGMATPVLAAVKMVELALVALALAGVVRRRDIWFLPALTGWLAGFAVFAVLDVVKGKWGGLLEHAVYLAAFALLLFVSYGLSVKARVGRAAKAQPRPEAAQAAQAAQSVPAGDAPAPAAPPAAAPVPAPGSAPVPGRPLTRTQEFALATLNRWQEAAKSATGGNALPWQHNQRPAPAPASTPAPSSAPAPAPAPSPAPAPAAPSAAGTEVTRAEGLPLPKPPAPTPPPEAAEPPAAPDAPDADDDTVSEDDSETVADTGSRQDSEATQAFEPPKPRASGDVPANATRPMELPDEPEK
ncbi:hypothetical protein [Spirillospora sp. NPDC029432]|uniref:hypothetical protein n=1 Tax=Spirillospora sp. NPDC029432 TaxID=3154599 RepID=UPI003455CF16